MKRRFQKKYDDKLYKQYLHIGRKLDQARPPKQVFNDITFEEVKNSITSLYNKSYVDMTSREKEIFSIGVHNKLVPREEKRKKIREMRDENIKDKKRQKLLKEQDLLMRKDLRIR